MQARAIFEAAVNAQRKAGKAVRPEVMIPFIAYRREFDILRAVITDTAKAVAAETGVTIPFDVGTMIELPRAALRAADIAGGKAGADFFSFGTNDLTQTTLGLSRDDAAPILSNYIENEVISVDPFISIDQSGVGELVKIGVERGRAAKPSLKTGICGEHGGDPKSIGFFEAIDLDYVSCSPYRVPIARLAAAQAAIRRRRHELALSS
jgi:pyruvate,orthophosphate dikinase